ncbi:16031_t:CDS:2 [Acaulospora morrowiae]|uniref:16031_t:CDS:1 n=1 Tax=Acaulospora morrowiae TaxID=94023 RepID=A0A9N9BT70_9GLOM|nr:16031_t:CDS:2 [Acaulospora morrowiae]
MAGYSLIQDDEIYSQTSDSVLSGDIHRDSFSDQAPLLEDVEEDSEVQYGSASHFSCAINLSNTILGTGMLAMPAAIASTGLLLGSIMIFYAASASALGLYFLSLAAVSTKGRNSSFFAVSKLTYPKAALFFDIAIAIKCFGVGISYLIIIGDLMPQIVDSLVGSEKAAVFIDRQFWITIFMIIIVPLAFLKRLDSLRHTSLIALLAVIYLLFIVIYYFFGPEYQAPPKDKIHLIKFSSQFFTNLPIFVFAFTCHQNIFSIYNELEDNSQSSINGVIIGSIGTTSMIYQVIGILGYLSFGDDVSANIISMYESSTIVTIGRIAIVILVLFSYPLQAHPARACLDKVLLSLQSRPDKIPRSPSGIRYILLTSGILIGSYIIAMLVSELDIVLAFVGSTGSTSVSFILPGLFYYKLNENSPWDTRKILSVCLATYGIFVMTICLTSNIYRVSYAL